MHPKPPIRRTHSPEFKASVLAACRQPGASIAAVALAHGLNANVVHKWLAGIGMKRCARHLPVAAPSPIGYLILTFCLRIFEITCLRRRLGFEVLHEQMIQCSLSADLPDLE